MTRDLNASRILSVFSRVDEHRRIASLIRSHSTNPRDIRAIALDAIDTRAARSILELGCGFGSFLGALEGRIAQEAHLTGMDIVPAYEGPFLDACRRIGIQGRFLAEGAQRISACPDRSYDLILCSFALYFFPEVIPHIARILRQGGVFIAITHDRRNMGELMDITKEILRNLGLPPENGRLPIEGILSRFCAENGLALLAPHFGRVQTLDYDNNLVFQPHDMDRLVTYFRFKGPLFLGGADDETEALVHRVALALEQSSLRHQGLVLSKDDRIFICSDPGRPGP